MEIYGANSPQEYLSCETTCRPARLVPFNYRDSPIFVATINLSRSEAPKVLSLAGQRWHVHSESTATGPSAFLVGPVYRLRVTNIPSQPEAELFPTLEVIDRTYPPSEREHRFPIVVELDDRDIEAALQVTLSRESSTWKTRPMQNPTAMQQVHNASTTWASRRHIESGRSVRTSACHFEDRLSNP